MPDPFDDAAQAIQDLSNKIASEQPSTPEEETNEDPLIALRHSIQEASALFDAMCDSRHEYGQKKYSEFSYVQAPTLQMALEEVADLANYARYTFIKIWLLRQAIERAQVTAMQKVGGSTGGFISTRDIMGAKE